MKLDQYLSVDKKWFESLTKEDQILWIKKSKHIRTTAGANKLLKGVSSKKKNK